MAEPYGNPDEITGISKPGLPDVALFYHLSYWREQLARSIARNNHEVRSDEIAGVVNRIIFFLVFLRVARDKGLIRGETIDRIFENGNLYQNLLHLARESGDPWEDLDGGLPRHRIRYEDVIVEERVLRPILEHAFILHRSHELVALPLSAFTVIFARYLEKTVKRSATQKATIVDTHDTILSSRSLAPTDRMIEYTVESTLHAARDNRSKRELLPFRVVDPACGSGRVLLAALKYLVGKWGGDVCTFPEKRQILFDSIHGIDEDRHAVAATRMLLVLWLMEGETAQSLPDDFFSVTRNAFRELRYTIRHGNALVGPGIAEEDCWMYVSPKERSDLTPFSWQTGFPEIFSAGGFDAIIGSFPNGPLEPKEWIQQYFQRHYAVYEPGIDRSAYFIEAGLPLLRSGGSLGFCMSDDWLRGRAGGPLRMLLKTTEIGEIVDFPGSERRKNPPGLCIVRVINRAATPKKFTAVIANPLIAGDLAAYTKLHGFPVDPVALPDGGWAFSDSRAENLLKKIAGSGTPFENFVMGQVHAGIVVDPEFVINGTTRDQILRADPRAKPFIRPLISCTKIGRYRIFTGDQFVIFVPRGWTRAHPASATNPWRWFKRRHPSIARQLRRAGADRRIPGEHKDLWWEGGGLITSKEPRQGILFSALFQNPAFAYDPGIAIVDETVNVIESSSLYLLGLLNSRLIAFFLNYLRNVSGTASGSFSRDELMSVPIYTPDLDDPDDRARHDRMIALVTRMNHLEKKRVATNEETAAIRIQKEIRAVDRKIDALVYDLYSLTPDEISFAESAAMSLDSLS